jgi:hypothetical protein
MRITMFLIATLLCGVSLSQEVSINKFITDTLNQVKAGSCGSPDGPTTEIASPPPNYQYLEDNGYCMYSFGAGVQTACFTMTSPGTDISFNAGYQVSGCANTSFGNFELYDASCNLVGTGLSFTGLTPGADYVWCLTMNSWGGGPGCTGFSNFCPYYIDNTVPLPISLLSFTGNCKYIEWTTSSETNNDYFIIEQSSDGESWRNLDTMSGSGFSSSSKNYRYYIPNRRPLYYYRLIQVDFDGKRKIYNPIAVECEKKSTQVESTYNVLGERCKITSKGYVFIRYTDGYVDIIYNE